MSQWTAALDDIRRAPAVRIGMATTKSLFTGPNGREWRGVRISPVELHKAAGLDRNTYAIARCVSSEIGSKAASEGLLCIAEAILNEAKAKGKDAYNNLVFRTTADYAFTEGYYGEQHGRWASTSQDPHGRALAAARHAILGSRLSNGARRWFDAKVQDSGAQGSRKLNYDGIGIAKKWGAEGWHWIGSVPNVNSYSDAAFFRFEAGNPTENVLLQEVIKAARGGARHDVEVAADESGLPLWLAAAGGIGWAVIG